MHLPDWKVQGEGEGVQIVERTLRSLGRLYQQLLNLPAAAPYLTTARYATLTGCMEERWCAERLVLDPGDHGNASAVDCDWRD
jgi:hypothetical protein